MSQFERYIDELNRDLEIPETVQKRIDDTLAGLPDMGKENTGTYVAGHAIEFRKRRFPLRKAAGVVLAATMVAGTTVFGGNIVKQIYLEKTGNYRVETQISSNDSSKDTVYEKAPEEIPVVEIETSYIPEGMVQSEFRKESMYYGETPYMGGISMLIDSMDVSLSKKDLLLTDTYVVSAEELSIAGHDAVYLEKQVLNEDEISFDKKVYIVYPEVWRVLTIFGGTDMTKEEVLKVAENTTLVPTGETVPLSETLCWSRLDAEKAEQGGYSESKEKVTATAEEMSHLHEIGEEFSVSSSAADISGEWIITNDIMVKVTDVQIGDDLSLLEKTEGITDDIKKAVDEEGKLLSQKLQYVKKGDGIETLDEIVKTETVARKLVYVTLEYTNTGKDELKDLLYFCGFLGLKEENGIYTIYQKAVADESEDWDEVLGAGIGINQTALDCGYVDIRQK